MSDENDDWGDKKERRESFIRWQQVTVKHFSYTVNLLLAFSGAVIGFEISTYLNERFALSFCDKSTYVTSLITLTFSICFGLLATLTRLLDFRGTARVAKLRWKYSDRLVEINLREEKNRKLGQTSWIFFYIQLSLFGLGMLLAAFVYLNFILG